MRLIQAHGYLAVRREGVAEPGHRVEEERAVHEVEVVAEVCIAEIRHVDHDVPAAALHGLLFVVHERDAEAEREARAHYHAFMEPAYLPERYAEKAG